ncbi:hypothetical protein [Sphingomonas sp.]|uniref:hypothetical protein n=1 Tax=Sphingomonas sp. TaxID=28214 RepID=UPI000DB82DAC|nr:hypothetical protein [Sphingomonas sp.]PZU09600.1 MAG: hypothetical protein DI605_07955 [Sphingomonas sp.]
MRISPIFSAASLALAMLGAAPAMAQDVGADVRCLLVSNAFAATEKDQAKKQFAIEASHFFFGRVDVRVTQPQLKAQIVAVSKTLRPQDMAPTMNACVKRLQDRQRVMQVIGREIAAANPRPPVPVKK